MLEKVEAGQHIQDLKMDVLQAIQYIIQILDVDLNKAIKALRLPNMMQLKEFLTIPEENIVYEISEDEIISELANIFKKNTNHPDEIDDSTEAEIISINEALKCLKTLNLFLLQQENANEHIKLVDIIEKYIKRK
ncbi:13150_t:CDS:2 [Rhizophagus irregularis]|nr:13150_t:CDS:2 [Rhizophagus irregularis]